MTNVTIVTEANCCEIAIEIGRSWYYAGKSLEQAANDAMELLEETEENRVAYMVTLIQCYNNAISAWLQEEENAQNG